MTSRLFAIGVISLVSYLQENNKSEIAEITIINSPIPFREKCLINI